MKAMASPIPDDVAALKEALAAAVQRADMAEAEAAAARAQLAEDQALIAHLKLLIAKYRRERFGVSSERTGRLLDQLELQLEELEAGATEDELAAEKAAARASAPVTAFSRRKPARQPFPDHLPRERIVIEAPSSCTCCGGDRPGASAFPCPAARLGRSQASGPDHLREVWPASAAQPPV